MKKLNLSKAHQMDLMIRRSMEASIPPDEKARERFRCPAYSTLGYLKKKKMDVQKYRIAGTETGRTVRFNRHV